jgi:hypothetical protein
MSAYFFMRACALIKLPLRVLRAYCLLRSTEFIVGLQLLGTEPMGNREGGYPYNALKGVDLGVVWKLILYHH